MARIICIGGGPAGLYLAILLRKANAGHQVEVHERHPRGHVEGWGVTLWEELLEDLAEDDGETARLIRESAVRWRNHILMRNGRRVFHSGRGGYSIGRNVLIGILTSRAEQLGADLQFSCETSERPDADLVVACDGVGSRLRHASQDRLGTRVRVRRNKFIWLGVRTVFDAFLYAVENTSSGPVWFYGYPFSAEMSTCVVECAPETWQALGLDRSSAEESASLLNRIFAKSLNGQRLLTGGSTWQNFREVTNRSWHAGKLVLIGDAAHTTHFSTGSGTRLALEDARALAAALGRTADIPAALEAFGKSRPKQIRQIQSEALHSLQWWENFDRYDKVDDDQAFFRILRERRSPLLPYMPVRLYDRLHHASQTLPALNRLRAWLGPRARALYSRIER